MASKRAGQSGQGSVERYRARMRKAGFRLVQLWVPNTRADGFVRECRRQSRAASRHTPHENAVLEWLGKASDTEDWTA